VAGAVELVAKAMRAYPAYMLIASKADGGRPAPDGPARPYLVFDGHDGCGKSTLAAAAAARLGCVVVKPFADTLGDHIAWLWRNRRFAEADHLARSSVERILDRYHGVRLVFDRHWATMFSVLPAEYRPGWGQLPPTVICRADTTTVMDRLRQRGEPEGDRAQHDHYDRVYVDLATLAHGALVLDTTRTPIAECIAKVSEFVQATRHATGTGVTRST
jgi:broad-specificity NMP kinase